jgi:hypothetical protein
MLQLKKAADITLSGAYDEAQWASGNFGILFAREDTRQHLFTQIQHTHQLVITAYPAPFSFLVSHLHSIN